MTIVETSWQEFLSPDSEIPHDVHFLAKRLEDEGNDSSKPIGAHKVLLAGVSPVFRRMLFGPLKEEREVIEVKDTTDEAFKTMIKFIYKPPRSRFFHAPYDYEDYEDYEEDQFNLTVIQCPQKFFDLVDLAEKYEISSLKEALTSDVLTTLAITDDNLIFAATVAMKYKTPFQKISTKCLKFLLQRTRSQAEEDLWTQFWALVNNSEESLKERQVKLVVKGQHTYHHNHNGRLAETPFVNLKIHHDFLKAKLAEMGRTAYDNCLYMACSGVHVR